MGSSLWLLFLGFTITYGLHSALPFLEPDSHASSSAHDFIHDQEIRKGWVFKEARGLFINLRGEKDLSSLVHIHCLQYLFVLII